MIRHYPQMAEKAEKLARAIVKDKSFDAEAMLAVYIRRLWDKDFEQYDMDMEALDYYEMNSILKW